MSPAQSLQSYSGTGVNDASERGEVLLSSAILNASDRVSADTEIVLTKKSRRIPALDFTKGALVLIMVLYHWMNYFVMADGSIYKYLRFLTPSFIFITGFLISQVYFSKYKKSNLHVPGRLVVRGLKLLTIVLCLNMALSAVQLNGFKTRMTGWSASEVATAYVTGTAPVAFSVLVPIAYLLILSAALLIVSQRYRNVYHVASAVFVGCALFLEFEEINGGYLQLLSMGMLGISIGHIPIDRIDRFMKRRVTIFLAYLAYLSAITVWNDPYPLQIVGVCLSLAVIYGIGVADAEASLTRKIVILLGQYSLFAYIAQIVILQIFRRALHLFGTGIGMSAAAFLACVLCTIFSVEALDRARKKMSGLNRLYSAVFC